MHMLYQSDSFVVVRFGPQGSDDADTQPCSGLEIVDRHARKEVFLQGAVAESFLLGAQALAAQDSSADDYDAYIAGFAVLAQQPLNLH